jgi:hypothetical protein
VVGRGAVVEIVDQGLGMSRDQIAHANQVLAEPPAFSVTNLSSDSRMGLLVVSRIAARNGVMVKLSESDYGGIRAIVLIPTTLIVMDGQGQRPVGVGVGAGYGAVEANGDATRNGAAVATAPPPVPWPTMEPGEPISPPHPEPRHSRREPASPAPYENPALSYENPAPAAEQGVQPTAGRPTLPRRRRQASLSPQLTNQPQQPTQSGEVRERSPEHSRDLFSAIESGTRQGRMARQEPGTNYDRREGPR